MKKFCRICKKEKDLSEFTSKSKKQHPIGTCKICRVERMRFARKKYKLNNKEKEKASRRRRDRERRDFDLNFKLRKNISRIIRKCIKKNKSGLHWEKIVGYSLNDLISYFKNTSNYLIEDYLNGKLHIDHIIPVSAYSFSSYEDEEFKKCWNLRNLRLIPAKENLTKNAKLDTILIEKYGIKDLMPK